MRSTDSHFFAAERGNVLHPKFSSLNFGTDEGPCLASHLACSLIIIGSTFSLECLSAGLVSFTAFTGFGTGETDVFLRAGET